MYLDFYRLDEKPFNATPDPKFLYLTPAHREALAQLVYGVQESKGFMILTGEVGTGKTTLLHTLVRKLDTSTPVAFVTNSLLPFDGILEYALEDFGVRDAGSTTAQRLAALNRFLIERWREGQKAVLILDEAQNLAPETLEQVRLLSNFETPTEKLLQILLVGQPELKLKLQLPELRQLRQRIGMQASIRPLTPEETCDYVQSRLRKAGAPDLKLFSDQATERIAAYTGGVPRLVNIVCDHCLLIGYADERQRIDRDTVLKAIEYLEEGKRPARAEGLTWQQGPPVLRWVLGGLGAAVVGGLSVFVLGTGVSQGAWDSILQHLLDIARGARDLVTR